MNHDVPDTDNVMEEEEENNHAHTNHDGILLLQGENPFVQLAGPSQQMNIYLNGFNFTGAPQTQPALNNNVTLAYSRYENKLIFRGTNHVGFTVNDTDILHELQALKRAIDELQKKMNTVEQQLEAVYLAPGMPGFEAAEKDWNHSLDHLSSVIDSDTREKEMK